MREFSADQFTERAAIREYEGGMTRFAAETAAAQEQGVPRWKALQLAKEADNANGRGPAGATRHHADALGGQRDAGDVSGVQPGAKEEARPMLEREPQAGWDRGALLALRQGNGSTL